MEDFALCVLLLRYDLHLCLICKASLYYRHALQRQDPDTSFLRWNGLRSLCILFIFAFFLWCTGEVSFHSSLNFHKAEGNKTERPREVFTIIFMDQDMQLAEPINEYQHMDRDA